MPQCYIFLYCTDTDVNVRTETVKQCFGHMVGFMDWKWMHWGMCITTENIGGKVKEQNCAIKCQKLVTSRSVGYDSR